MDIQTKVKHLASQADKNQNDEHAFENHMVKYLWVYEKHQRRN